MSNKALLVALFLISFSFLSTVKAWANCSTAHNCGDCLQIPKCGWCNSLSKCTSGNVFGPVEGSCPSWDYFNCIEAPAWPTLGNGPAHTGAFVGSTAISRKTLSAPMYLYNVTFNMSATSASTYQVAVANGLVFVSIAQDSSSDSTQGYLHAVNEGTGSIVWTYDFGKILKLNPPTYDNGVVYIQYTNINGNGFVNALNATTGDVKWSSPFKTQLQNYLQPVVADGQVCVNGGSNGGVYCYSAETGQQLFYISMISYNSYRWTPAYSNGRLFTASGSNFSEINFKTGAIAWSLKLPYRWESTIGTSPVLNLPLAFVAGRNSKNELAAINVDTKAIVWYTTVSCFRTGITPIHAIDDKYVYLPCDSVIYILDQQSGSIEGKIGLPSSYSVPTAQILLTDTEIIIPTRGGVIAYDKQSNSETWRIPTTKYLTVPNPYITYDGRLFITYANYLLTYLV